MDARFDNFKRLLAAPLRVFAQAGEGYPVTLAVGAKNATRTTLESAPITSATGVSEPPIAAPSPHDGHERILLTTTLAHARAYAARGWHIMPVRGEVPALAGSVGIATTNQGQIREWFEGNPVYGIAIATGSASGLFVLDVDNRPDNNGFASLAELEKAIGTLPETLKAKTGGGGLHHYFWHPPGITLPNSEGKLGRGLDTLGEGRVVIAPPTVHPDTGVRYQWLDDPMTTPLADVPVALIALLYTNSQLAVGSAAKHNG